MARKTFRVALEFFVACVEEALIARSVAVRRIIAVSIGGIILRIGSIGIVAVILVLRKRSAVGRNVQARHIVFRLRHDDGLHRGGAGGNGLGSTAVIDACGIAEEVRLIGKGGLEGVHGLLHLVAGDIGLAEIRVHFIARGRIHVELQGALVGLHRIGGTVERHEAHAKIQQSLRRIGVFGVKSRLAKRHAGLSVFAKLEQCVAQAQIRLIRSIVFRVGHGDFKMRDGIFVVVQKRIRLGKIAVDCAARVVGGIGGGLRIGMNSLAEILHLQETVADLMVDIAQLARTLLNGGVGETLVEQGQRSLKIAGFVRLACLGDIFVIHRFFLQCRGDVSHARNV